MIRMIRSPWPCVVAVLAACSSSPSGSGVTETKPLNTLSDSERNQLCSFRTEVEHAPRTATCMGTSSVMIEDTASCVAAFSAVDALCQATVSDAEACFHAFDADPCNHGAGGCTALFTCVLPTG
ncbi:MAG TPA: hypothetical protein VHT91_30635 [Kofleriaceae bacterium]|jgi:hypothetical protein|nr:hypothetical protein [Kofleriaceae bacterium]